MLDQTLIPERLAEKMHRPPDQRPETSWPWPSRRQRRRGRFGRYMRTCPFAGVELHVHVPSTPRPMTDARVLKIAKLRAKAQSTSYPAEAEAFRRKALAPMERDRIGEDAVQRALTEFFGGRPEPRQRSAPGPSADRPAERGSMVEAVVWVFEEQGNRLMRARELWTLIQERGLYMRSRGRTPRATIAAKLSTDPLFERVAPGLYRLRR